MSGISHVRRKVLPTSLTQQCVTDKQLQHICSVCCVTRYIMLSLAIFTFFTLNTLVHVPAARVWHHLLTPHRAVIRLIAYDVCLPDTRLAEFVLMNTGYSAFVSNLGQVRQIFVAISQPDQTNTEIKALNRCRPKFIHIIRCMQSFRTE